MLPDPYGFLGFGILAAAGLFYLVVEPDAEGYLFRGLFPDGTSLAGPLAEAILEGLAQAFLLVAPAVSLYAGARHLFREGDSLLPYITVLGGGFLTLLVGIALFAA